MYLIRRGYRVAEPRDTRLAATIIAEIGKVYEDAGQRSPTRVYFNSGTTPGDKGVVYLEWTAESLESPYREGNVFPSFPEHLGPKLREITTESWIEFYELMVPAKAMALDT
jgi:hypothetical protein